MTSWRSSRWPNPAAIYIMIGLLLLAFSLFIPWLSASRTTRVELRASGLAEALLDATHGFAPPLDNAALAAIEGRFFALAKSRGEYTADLERVASPPEGALLCLINKHYAFQLSESPPAVDQRPGKDTIAALEVTAWPRRSIGPGHCAFFYPDNALRAFTRNLRASYAGLGADRPTPGAPHRRPGLGSRRLSPYPGRDSERWLIF